MRAADVRVVVRVRRVRGSMMEKWDAVRCAGYDATSRG